MPTDVIMPQMGESIFEGTITKWLKQAGDRVQKDEPLFEISTDKVDAEIPSPVAGVLSEIKFKEGTTVEINTVVAVVAESGEAAEAVQVPEAAAGSPPAAPATRVPASQAPAIQQPAPSHAPVKDRVTSTHAAGIDVVMPQMGESIFEGTITKWLKKAGDSVEKDEPLFEISTDKVDAEIPSPVAGILTEIKFQTGATVQINTVVAVIGGPSAVPSVAPAGSAETHFQSTPAAAGASRPATEAITATAAELVESAASSSDHPQRSSPLVRRIARENGLDLRRIAGTGSAGRITKEDVLKHLAERATASTVALSAAVSTRPTPKETEATSLLLGQVVPLSRMRAIIADRMVESVAVSPHVYTVYKVDMTRIVHLRERERSRFEQKNGVKLTFMPFIAAAAIEALRHHPIVNASLLSLPNQPKSIHYHQNIHLGIAVALEWGLIVPVVKQADTLSFAALARSMADLAERARTKKLKPEEATGSTFTLTNSGVFGGEFGTPIINQPESAILAIGGLKKEPVVITDAEGSDAIAIRAMQSYCLGFDHRLIDGADGGKFMSMFKRVLETWDREVG
ncbi:MAG: 2-oxoglutarate dehydrogenase, E2 component, dihydrolipoamide succinyltransferase [Terracidiphilus sp.]|jgi:2-oxoglutarate dehydrogenase E2 component (dihydrolipoamide succinyltransferase)